MKMQILGSGCAKCRTLTAVAEQAARTLYSRTGAHWLVRDSAREANCSAVNRCPDRYSTGRVGSSIC